MHHNALYCVFDVQDNDDNDDDDDADGVDDDGGGDDDDGGDDDRDDDNELKVRPVIAENPWLKNDKKRLNR